MKRGYLAQIITLLAPILLKAIDKFIRSKTKKQDYDDVKWINSMIIDLINQFNVKLSLSDFVAGCIEHNEYVQDRLPSFDEAMGCESYT